MTTACRPRSCFVADAAEALFDSPSSLPRRDMRPHLEPVAAIRTFSIVSGIILPSMSVASICDMKFRYVPHFEWLSVPPSLSMVAAASAVVSFFVFRSKGRL